MDISRAKIAIFTHYLVYGAPQALRDYLIDKQVGELLFIAHPLYADETRSYKENINKGKVRHRYDSNIRTRFSLLNYILEFFLTGVWVLGHRQKLDLIIAVDNLNAFTAILLKKLGATQKVIFYTIDYVPQRFPNQFLNNLYHYLDKYCVANADETWNVSPRIALGRTEIKGLRGKKFSRQKVVPIGVWLKEVQRLPFHKINNHELLFVGHLLGKQGVQIVINAIPKIIEQIPNFHFLIVGGGKYESQLKILANQLKLNKHITFTGWVKDRKKLDKLMANSALAIAMYDANQADFTYYADPTKLKDYLSAGLPVLLTDVPHNAKDIAKAGAGEIISYDSKILAEKIINILKDKRKLMKYRQNALTFIKRYDWGDIFDKQFKSL